MKSSRALTATGLMVAAVLLGLLTVQGSYALWNKALTSTAGTVQAADFRIILTDTITSQSTDMTLPDGTPATLSLSTTPVGVVLPGHSEYAGVELANLTNAGGDFTVAASTLTPQITGAGASNLTPYLQIKTVKAASLAQCSQAALYSAVDTLATATQEIAKTATGVFCFQVTLLASMPASFTGQTAAVAIPIVVSQL